MNGVRKSMISKDFKENCIYKWKTQELLQLQYSHLDCHVFVKQKQRFKSPDMYLSINKDAPEEHKRKTFGKQYLERNASGLKLRGRCFPITTGYRRRNGNISGLVTEHRLYKCYSLPERNVWNSDISE
jgi:hypothetical protein